ncbi:3-hydroxy-3-methylglutaryl-coenzyme A (HMG-CoA) reductase isozyme, partial [Coemansia helicoidea]
DYLFEIGILAIGVCSGVPGLCEVCLVSSFILLFDGLFLFTLYTAILTLKLDLIRVRSESKLANSTSSSAAAAAADDDADEVAKDASPAMYKQIALQALSDDQARSENKTIRQLKTLVLGGFILISCIESSGYMSGTFSLKALFSGARSDAVDALIESARYPMLDQIAAPLVALVSQIAAAGSDSAPRPLRVQFLPVASWTIDGAGAAGPPSPAAALGAVAEPLDGSSVVIALLALAVIASLGVNIYYALFSAAAAGPQSAGQPAAFDAIMRSRSMTSLSSRHNAASSEDGFDDTTSERSTTLAPTPTVTVTAAATADRACASLEAARAALLTRKLSATGLSASSSGASTPGHGIALHSTSALSSFVPRIDSTTDMVLKKSPSVLASFIAAHTVPEESSVDASCVRPLGECQAVFAADGPQHLNDDEVILLVGAGTIPAYALERHLRDNVRAIKVRRALISRASATGTLEASQLPYHHYDYSKVHGQCCEN